MLSPQGYTFWFLSPSACWRTRPGWGQAGEQDLLFYDFLPPCLTLADRASGDTAAVSSVTKVSALFVARSPGPVPPGLGLWGVCEVGAI